MLACVLSRYNFISYECFVCLKFSFAVRIRKSDSKKKYRNTSQTADLYTMGRPFETGLYMLNSIFGWLIYLLNGLFTLYGVVGKESDQGPFTSLSRVKFLYECLLIGEMEIFKWYTAQMQWERTEKKEKDKHWIIITCTPHLSSSR